MGLFLGKLGKLTAHLVVKVLIETNLQFPRTHRFPSSIFVVNIFTKLPSKFVYFATLCLALYMGVLQAVMRNFTDRLRGMREDNDMTQAQIAKVLGTSQTMYARYERGANEMPIRHLVTLCTFYNVSADYFLDTHPDKKRRSGVAPKLR